MALTTVLLVDALLAATCLLPVIRQSRYLTTYILCATGVLVLWQLALFCAGRYRGVRLTVGRNVKKAHFAQLCAQSGVYVYWGLYWTPVREHVPLIVVQLLFAYALDMVLTWTRGRVWNVGFGPFPIILSINLFLWFREQYFYLQFFLVLLTYLAKHFIQWKRDGQWKHIFNPSGFSLALTSVVLLVTQTIYTTWGLDFILSFQLGPNIFEVMFLAGLFGQFSFRVVLVTFGAGLAMLAWFLAGLGPTPIDPAVFLGMTLLVTDPVTSPNTACGKFFYGNLYGLGVCVTFVLLGSNGLPSYFDKLLIVPVVNALAPLIDKLTGNLRLGNLTLGRGWHMLLYVCFFLAVAPFLQSPLRNKLAAVRTMALPEKPDPAVDYTGLLPSPEMQALLQKQARLREAHPDCFAPFSFLHEPEYWRSWNAY